MLRGAIKDFFLLTGAMHERLMREPDLYEVVIPVRRRVFFTEDSVSHQDFSRYHFSLAKGIFYIYIVFIVIAIQYHVG